MGKGSQNSVLCWEGAPFSKDPLSEVPLHSHTLPNSSRSFLTSEKRTTSQYGWSQSVLHSKGSTVAVYITLVCSLWSSAVYVILVCALLCMLYLCVPFGPQLCMLYLCVPFCPQLCILHLCVPFGPHMSNERLCHLQVVVEGSKMQRCEAVVLWLVDGAVRGQVGQDEPHGPHVAPQGGVVQAVEAVAVGEGDVHLALHQQLHHVVALLRDGVVEGRVSVSILARSEVS